MLNRAAKSLNGLSPMPQRKPLSSPLLTQTSPHFPRSPKLPRTPTPQRNSSSPRLTRKTIEPAAPGFSLMDMAKGLNVADSSVKTDLLGYQVAPPPNLHSPPPLTLTHQPPHPSTPRSARVLVIDSSVECQYRIKQRRSVDDRA